MIDYCRKNICTEYPRRTIEKFKALIKIHMYRNIMQLCRNLVRDCDILSHWEQYQTQEEDMIHTCLSIL